jgi:hypothetical protein
VLDVLAPIVSALSGWIGVAAVRTLGKDGATRRGSSRATASSRPGRTASCAIRSTRRCSASCSRRTSRSATGSGLLVAGAVFVIGTTIRIRAEEKLLREAFGGEYADYASRVPAFIPLLRGV